MSTRKFRVVLEEVKDNGLTENQCQMVRNILSDIRDDDGVRIQLAWAYAMIDANINNSVSNTENSIKKGVMEQTQNWKRTDLVLPSDGVIVETKISDCKGERNVCRLKRVNNLWFFPDGSMYVYYKPTHWRKV